MNEMVFYLAVGGFVYMLIFHTGKVKEINEMGYDNIRRTTGGLAKAGRTGFKLYQMFRK